MQWAEWLGHYSFISINYIVMIIYTPDLLKGCIVKK